MQINKTEIITTPAALESGNVFDLFKKDLLAIGVDSHFCISDIKIRFDEGDQMSDLGRIDFNGFDNKKGQRVIYVHPDNHITGNSFQERVIRLEYINFHFYVSTAFPVESKNMCTIRFTKLLNKKCRISFIASN